MTKIPPDDILEGLYKLRVRESETLKIVLGLYNMEDSSEEGWTWLSQIKDNGKNKHRAEFTKKEAQNGNYERKATVKNHVVQQREQKKFRRLLAMES